jgi:hypothetical protein
VFLVAQGIANQAVSCAEKFLGDSCGAVKLLEEAAASVSEVIRPKKPLHEFEDFGPDNIQAKHLAVMDVEENSSVHCLCAPDCVGYFEHGTLFSSEIDVIASGAEDCRTPAGREFQKLLSMFASGPLPPASSCEDGTYNEEAKAAGDREGGAIFWSNARRKLGGANGVRCRA